MVHAVVSVDAEPEGCEDPYRDVVEAMEGGEAGHVLFRGPDARLVAAHQNVRAPVDQDHCIQFEDLGQRLVNGSERLRPRGGKRVDRLGTAVGSEPSGESSFREISVVTETVRLYPGEAGSDPEVLIGQ